MSKTVYGFCSAGCKYPVASKEDVPYKIIEISKEAYESLSEAERKAPGVMYVVDEPLVAVKVTESIREHYLEDIFVFDDGDNMTPVVYNSKYTKGESLGIEQDLKKVFIPTIGSYVITVAQCYKGETTPQYYYTAFLNVLDLKKGCSTTITEFDVESTNNIKGLCNIYLNVSNQSLVITSNDSTYDYKFADCRLLSAY